MRDRTIDVSVENWEKSIDNSNEYTLLREGKIIGKLLPMTIFNPKDVVDVISVKTKYCIPSFQRGYRWEEKQVLDLLKDIWDWNAKEQNKQYKYCLQPLVIIESSDPDYDYDVIDGQQRLTTLFIILKAINKEVKFSINYATREGSSEYLDKIGGNLVDSDKNIDYYHMFNAYQTVNKFFIDNQYDSDIWYEKLVDSSSGAFFIEYIISKDIDSRSCEQIFSGLNAGKIPLTNSELVKAMILRKQNFNKANSYQNEFIEIAQEWDRIEKRLRDRQFWSWLGEPFTDQPHIDVVLNIVARNINDKLHYRFNSESPSFSYLVFQHFLDQENNTIFTLWNDIKTCFMTLEDWYESIEIYNLVGYINLNNKINKKLFTLYFDYNNDDNFSFKNIIRKYLKNVDLGTLEYDSSEIANILLLFNIVTSIKNKVKFPFDLYRMSLYDVEHIFPQSEIDNLRTNKERIEWLESIISSDLFTNLIIEFDGSKGSLQENKSSITSKIDDDDKFKQIYNTIITNGLSKNDIISMTNRLGNLCLLDSKTNRGYGNKPFPNKVREITELDAKSLENQYVLPCTKNVFLKYYSGLNINNYVWTNDDADKYEKNLISMIEEYFAIGSGKNA